ncbi:Abi family protein [Mycoplasma feriruminatoris]|uniref:Abi family protein n=1 Tax=Mycoplasma feriruminatoris TaxID=1179777 RepID=UPI0002A4FD67|nr:Abi family protein [Mycoplasma feriruminatoris]UKS54352.1 abi-like family protein [Mycoplasma feriruminatoris]VZS00584.1 hypothetical protein MF5583_00678 [Mycoplasma feriruminatoris]
MKKPKEFKTFEEQIEILKSRGLKITDKQRTIEILKQENYYNIVNGYKDLFLEKNSFNNEDKFVEDTSFEELYSLFLFDRELRSVLLKYILLFERNFKTIVAYNFSKKYNKDNRVDSYLYPENYRDNYIEVLDFISALNKIIISKSEKTDYIKHYIEKYGHIPLWVAVNIMSFGNMTFMFKILKDEDKNQIVYYYVNRFLKTKELTSFESIIRDKTFLSGLKVLNIVRNICAHEERMYNAKFERITAKDISYIVDYDYYDKSKLIIVFMFLKIVLNEIDFSLLKDDLNKLFNKFSNAFSVISFNTILNEMGIKIEDFKRL